MSAIADLPSAVLNFVDAPAMADDREFDSFNMVERSWLKGLVTWADHRPPNSTSRLQPDDFVYESTSAGAGQVLENTLTYIWYALRHWGHSGYQKHS